MDINSKIKWTPGMPLTAQTMSFLDDMFINRKDVFVKAVLGSRTGLLPGTEFSCDAMFVGKTVEIGIKNCQAWLPSGMLVDIVEEKAAVPVPTLDEGVYYLCIQFGEDMVEFESKGVPLERPAYKYSILSESAFSDNVNFLPILKLVVCDGNVSIDQDYIVPCMLLGCDSRLVALSKELTERLTALTDHRNLNEDNGRKHVLYFRMASMYYDGRSDTLEYLRFTTELANVLCHYFRNDEAPEGADSLLSSVYDIRRWMSGLFSLIDASIKHLDELVIEDKSIDFEALKKQITDDVYERVKAETDERLSEMKEQIKKDLTEQIKASLLEFIEGEFKIALHDNLHTEIGDELRESLYKSLYEALYNALFVPEAEEEAYTPII